MISYLIWTRRVVAAFFSYRGKRVEIILDVLVRQINIRVIAANGSDREYEHQ